MASIRREPRPVSVGDDTLLVTKDVLGDLNVHLSVGAHGYHGKVTGCRPQEHLSTIGTDAEWTKPFWVVNNDLCGLSCCRRGERHSEYGKKESELRNHRLSSAIQATTGSAR